VTGQRPDIAAIRQRADAATPAPWHWRGNVDVHRIRLSAPRSPGEKTVMDLVRWGFQGAKPRFRDERQLMVGADALVEFEVCPEAETRDDPRVYRGDFIALRHPDAEFIAHARQDVDDLLAYIDHLEQVHE
jgi:hypothetical protein